MDKRTFLKTTTALGLTSLTTGNWAFASNNFRDHDYKIVNDKGEYILPPLPYAYDALEPSIDKETMKLHHDIHHQGYVNGLNTATKKINEAIQAGDFSLIKHWEREIAFHGSGHFLHSIFWKNMSPTPGEKSAKLKEYMAKDFGSYGKFKDYFMASTNAVEGSGWGILAYQPYADKLVIHQAEKHQNLTQWITHPLLVLDVWEHAYYLKYKNKRDEYIKAFFKVVDWKNISKRLEMFCKKKRK
ncbi:superoxide dismutase [Xanthovirga aplysinae]|uniref:superoxide dismutase n=1 Tax=Xanthovirga aplysinae TaxID=2529853 RepID=UPI0012BD4E5C|nr:superoxide dismutase [Xanthovirga aplysinae]MTI32566.1 superoxide dismutase [Xanthovirga aplysinae]